MKILGLALCLVAGMVTQCYGGWRATVGAMLGVIGTALYVGHNG